MNTVLVVDNLEFEVRRSNRRKTLGLTVDRAGELVVHAPEAATEAELSKWIEKKLLWVHQKLLQKKEHTGQVHRHKPVSGENIPILNGTDFALSSAQQKDSAIIEYFMKVSPHSVKPKYTYFPIIFIVFS